MYLALIFSVFAIVCFRNVLSGPVLNTKPCKASDSACLTDLAQMIYTATIEGNEEMGIDPSDPLHVDRIDGNLATLKYVLRNLSIIGFKHCQIIKADLLLEKSVFRFDLSCPAFSMTGQYAVNGTLLNLPIHGNGDFKIEGQGYYISLEAKTKLTNGKDGKMHIGFKDVKFTAEIKDSLKYYSSNLFEEQKGLSDNFTKFVNENWRLVYKDLQGPVLNENLKILMKKLNKFMNSIPFENIIST